MNYSEPADLAGPDDPDNPHVFAVYYTHLTLPTKA